VAVDRVLERSARRVWDDWAAPMVRALEGVGGRADEVMEALDDELSQDVRWRYPEVREWVHARASARL
jgi:hypothetical protein